MALDRVLHGGEKPRSHAAAMVDGLKWDSGNNACLSFHALAELARRGDLTIEHATGESGAIHLRIDPR